MAGYRLGIDIGGTFTDLVLVAEPEGREPGGQELDGHEAGRWVEGEGGSSERGGSRRAPAGARSRPAVALLKVPSTPDDYARSVLEGVRQLLAQTGYAPEEAIEVIHGSTVATNTLLERRGARTGLLTTRGFRDILEIRRMRVPRLYDLKWEKPPPLVERALRLEVDERLDHTGAVLRPLDEEGATAAIEQLRAAGVEAVAVCLLHAYASPVHEAQIGALLQRLAPDVYCTLSHEVLPQIKEYERTSTTAINAYLGPAVGRYLERMAAGLRELGVRAPVLVMQSNGGTMTAAAARRLPAQMVESGPAAGAIAAAALGRRTGVQRLLALDMGGTTAKAAFLQDGEVPLAPEAEIGAGVTVANRLNRGGGYLLSLPTVDLVEVGAGGGSLVWIDAGGVLCVGPQSAGATPGPVCYGAGGTVPTLTDANVALGYLNPGWLLGGALRLDAAAARRVLEASIGRPLGLSLEAAAFGARAIAVASMVRAVRAVSAERGHDPRTASLVAFGGNGPLHAAAVAEELGIPRVLVPPAPGLFSALGLLAADVEHHFLRTHLRRLDEVDEAAAASLHGLTEEMARAALATLAGEGYPPEQVALRWSADLRYLGQSFELTAPLAPPPETWTGAAAREALAGLAAAFGKAHRRAYGHDAPGEPVELVNVRLVARGVAGRPRGLTLGGGQEGWMDAREPARRAAYFGPALEWLETPVVGRGALAGRPHVGPVIVEEYDATTLVPPGWSAHLINDGTIELEPARS